MSFTIRVRTPRPNLVSAQPPARQCRRRNTSPHLCLCPQRAFTSGPPSPRDHEVRGHDGERGGGAQWSGAKLHSPPPRLQLNSPPCTPPLQEPGRHSSAEPPCLETSTCCLPGLRSSPPVPARDLPFPVSLFGSRTWRTKQYASGATFKVSASWPAWADTETRS